jgi:hypothetical protein
MTFDEFLERLDGVRRSGDDRAMARCPAHEDKRASLSVRELGDGTILLHCFALCEPLAICHAIKIEFRHLFPAGRIRRIDDRERPRLSAAAALAALGEEAMVVAIIGADFLARRSIDDATWSRLATAVRRISDARAVCCPPP